MKVFPIFKNIFKIGENKTTTNSVRKINKMTKPQRDEYFSKCDLPPIGNPTNTNKTPSSLGDFPPPLNGQKSVKKDVKKELAEYNSTSDFPPVGHM